MRKECNLNHWRHFFVEGYYCGECERCKAGEEILCKEFCYVDEPFCFKISDKILQALIWIDGFIFDCTYNSTLVWWWRARKYKERKND